MLRSRASDSGVSPVTCQWPLERYDFSVHTGDWESVDFPKCRFRAIRNKRLKFVDEVSKFRSGRGIAAY